MKESSSSNITDLFFRKVLKEHLGTQGTLALEHLRLLDTWKALEHGDLKQLGTWTFRHLRGTWALKYLKGTWTLRHSRHSTGGFEALALFSRLSEIIASQVEKKQKNKKNSRRRTEEEIESFAAILGDAEYDLRNLNKY